jgi:hypothetical protein
VTGCCEQGNECLSSIKDGKFLEPVSFSEGLCSMKSVVQYMLCAACEVEVNIYKIKCAFLPVFFSVHHF